MHVFIVADAAFARAQNGVVDNAVALEHVNFAVVHRDGDVHDDLLVRGLEDIVRGLIEAQNVGRDVEARHHGFQRIFTVQQRGRLFIHGVNYH